MSFAPAGTAGSGRAGGGGAGGLASGSIARILDSQNSSSSLASAAAGRRRARAGRTTSTSPHSSSSAGPTAAGGGASPMSSTAATNAMSSAQLCTFCSQPAALSVSSSLLSRPYCLLHYYTTRACRVGSSNPDRVHILGPDGGEIFGIEANTSEEGGGGMQSQQSEMARQLPEMQEQFALAYTALRDRIAKRLAATSSTAPANINTGRIPSTKGASAGVSSSNNTRKTDGKKKSPGGSATRRNAHDPLADLLGGPSPSASFASSFSAKKRGKKRPSSAQTPAQKPAAAGAKDDADNEGGFVRDVQLPTRYVEQQRRMAREEAQERRRQMQMSSSGAAGTSRGGGRPGGPKNPASAASAAASALHHVESNPYKRRKPNRSSIWNLAMDSNNNGGEGSAVGASAAPAAATSAASSSAKESSTKPSAWDAIERSMRPTVTCTCGSTDVSNDLNITGRGNDMPKGETWGFKDRSDVVVRYRCGRCGKTWNEEE